MCLNLTEQSYLLSHMQASPASFLALCAIRAAHVDARLRLQRAPQDLKILQRLAGILQQAATFPSSAALQFWNSFRC